MTWLDDFAAELSARGVPARERRRVVLELGDHIECEPGCEDRLGECRELAARFADELATARARSSAFEVFVALAMTAVALVVSQLAISHAGGYPGVRNGISLLLFVPAAVGMLVAPQVALVAGTLAAVRAARRRRVPRLPAAEIGLIGGRAHVALLAGFATVAGLELYVVDFALVLPVWYLSIVGGSATVAGLALYAAFSRLRRAQAIVCAGAGAGGDVYDDVPALRLGWLRHRPWRLGVLGSVIVGFVAVLFESHAEHSLTEGLQRGFVEALAAAAGFALLGRVVGLFPSDADGLSPARLTAAQLASEVSGGLIGGPEEQLVADEDRSRAEVALRESFARGRLSLEELTLRVSAIHDAETVGEVRKALTGLPPRP